jgi:hypothetical protein
MVIFKVHVVEMFINSSCCDFNLVELWWNVAQLIQVLRSYLRDVQVNQMTVVAVELVQLLFGKILSVDEPLNVDILVRKDHRRVSVSVSRGFSVVDLKVLFPLVLVN